MLISFFEDIADDGYSNLGMALGMLDDGYGPADRHYVRIFQPSDACDPVSYMRTNAAQNIVLWHTKPLC